MTKVYKVTFTGSYIIEAEGEGEAEEVATDHFEEGKASFDDLTFEFKVLAESKDNDKGLES
jgi:hypothetical protein